MKNTAINKWISTGTLAIIVLSVFFAYLNLKGIESCRNSESFGLLQFLLILIIGGSFVTWFLNFKMLMFITGLDIQIDDTIDEKILEHEKEIIEDTRDISGELEQIIKKLGKQNNIHDLSEKSLSVCCHALNYVTGVFFEKNKNEFSYINAWAYYNHQLPEKFELGIGLHGQAAKNCKALIIDDLPENYISILSGTGNGKPKTLYLIPIISNNECIAFMEFASFLEGNAKDLQLLEEIAKYLSSEITNINI